MDYSLHQSTWIVHFVSPFSSKFNNLSEIWHKPSHEIYCLHEWLYTFFLWGKGIFSIALILSGSMEVPFLETMWPNNLPSVTKNTHFLGFSEIPYFRQRSKIYFRWNACSSLFFENIMMSSRYTTALRPIKPQKAISIALWKVAPAFMSPKGIL